MINFSDCAYAVTNSPRTSILDDGMALLEWCTDPPKVAGWYWAQRRNRKNPECVFLGENPVENKFVNTLGHRFHGKEIDENFLRWLGPLPIPEKPE